METSIDTRELSPLVTAYIGDAYFHLYVRTRLLQITKKIDKLHDLSAEIVSATFQADAYKKIEKYLTEDERAIFKRGRNAKSHAPRVATVQEYHASTGFEALLGELFLTKNFARLEEICELALTEEGIFK
ncbi:MAG: ribonuclease III [Selenomonadaceae bacterium]|nr:ribonuclease III [Selenomonadaceae bacterium]